MSEVSFVFKGEEFKLDPDSPEDLALIKSGLEKGKLYDSKMHEISEEKKELDAVKAKAEMFERFEGQMQEIRNGADPSVLIEAINRETGLNLTKKEEAAIQDGEFFDEDSKLVQKLYKKMDALEHKIADSKADAMIIAKEDSAHTRLEAKLNGKDGYPAYDRDEVEKWCRDEGFFMKDIDKQFEQAYQIMHQKEIMAANNNGEIGKQQALRQKREKSAVESGQQNSYSFKDKPIDTKNKPYHELAREAADRAKADGISIFTDD